MPKTSIADLAREFRSNCERIDEIADTCERENRTRTETETSEYETLTSRNAMISMRMQAMQANNLEQVSASTLANADQMLRDARENHTDVTIMLTRSIMTTAGLANTGIIPVHQKEMLDPLRAGLIYDKVGIEIPTGLSGTLRWPTHGKATAQWADETAELTDSSIDFDKLEMTGKRLGIAIPVSRTELEDSEGLVERVVRQEMPLAIMDAINDALFTTSATHSDGGTARTVYGPFVEAYKTATEFAGAVPTRKELLKLKSKVTASGIKLVAPCWVMTEDMKAELEDSKVDAGSGRFICENDRIFGYPVFCTPSVGAGNVGFGDWSYQASGFFGQMALVIDPYTLARKHSTDFVLNTRFGTVTLRSDAFAVGKAKASS